jgi:hypothetical protein
MWQKLVQLWLTVVPGDGVPNLQRPLRGEEVALVMRRALDAVRGCAALFRLHVLIAVRSAGWRNDLEPSAARGRHLHLRINGGRWADDPPGLRKLVAQRSRVSLPHRRRLPLDVGRTRGARPRRGSFLRGRLR